jgi:16S rRNA (uracil1498-N3)-methyltransferase
VKTGLNIERMNKIIKEAAEQCGQNFLPEILPAMQFSEALAHGQNAEEKILFHLVDSEYAPDKNAGSVSIFVGPEGGFTPHEIKLAESFGYTPASLGELTLRGETAAIVATYRAVQKI